MWDKVRSLINLDSCGLERNVGQDQVTDKVGQLWISEKCGTRSGQVSYKVGQLWISETCGTRSGQVTDKFGQLWISEECGTRSGH
jgi:hypothetical protein